MMLESKDGGKKLKKYELSQALNSSTEVIQIQQLTNSTVASTSYLLSRTTTILQNFCAFFFFF